jgi:polar amino acid transport system substrate-binding protein
MQKESLPAVPLIPNRIRSRKRGLFLKLYQRVSAGFFLLILVVGLVSIYAYPAKTAEQPLRVVTRIIPPMVTQDKGNFSGFSIELWRAIATEIGVRYEISAVKTLPELLAAVESHRADAAVAAISINSQREQKVDFSFPILDAGLKIMVRDQGQSNPGQNLLNALLSPTFLQILAFALLTVLFIAHLIWLIERNHPEAMISQQYFPGIFEAMWWAAATLATQADQMPKGALSRIFAVIWMFIAVVFVSYFTAVITANMTVQKLQGDIQGINDLAGRQVGTTTGSTAANLLKENRLKTQEFPTIEQAFTALLNSSLDAIVADSPVLLYYAANEGQGKVRVLDPILQEEKYGIALQNNSPYLKQINTALLKLKENGTYETIHDRFFKAPTTAN